VSPLLGGGNAAIHSVFQVSMYLESEVFQEAYIVIKFHQSDGDILQYL
jgi:hypothetical protein